MNNNKKIIDANPAPYPKTSTPEYMSVVTLINILDKNRTRFDLNILDKFPNTDGIFEIVTEDQVPIGKLDIQVKILEKKNLKIPKYQCQKDFLAFEYCRFWTYNSKTKHTSIYRDGTINGLRNFETNR